jgi:hypothetical protein
MMITTKKARRMTKKKKRKKEISKFHKILKLNGTLHAGMTRKKLLKEMMKMKLLMMMKMSRKILQTKSKKNG